MQHCFALISIYTLPTSRFFLILWVTYLLCLYFFLHSSSSYFPVNTTWQNSSHPERLDWLDPHLQHLLAFISQSRLHYHAHKIISSGTNCIANTPYQHGYNTHRMFQSFSCLVFRFVFLVLSYRIVSLSSADSSANLC